MWFFRVHQTSSLHQQKSPIRQQHWQGVAAGVAARFAAGAGPRLVALQLQWIWAQLGQRSLSETVGGNRLKLKRF